MKIVVSGGWSYGNLGDEVIAKVTIGMMDKFFPEYDVTYTSYDPIDFEMHHKIKAIESVHSRLEKYGENISENVDKIISNPGKFGLEEYTEEISNADIFLMSGGGYFTGSWDSQFAARIAEIELAANSGAKVVVVGQSIGPFNSRGGAAGILEEGIR